MAITNEFMDAVQSGNMMRVRIMLKDSLLIDPTAAQFDEMELHAAEKMGNIYKIRNERKEIYSTSGITRKQVGAGITVAGSVAVVAGICTSHMALTIGGAAVAAVGVALIVSDKGNDKWEK